MGLAEGFEASARVLKWGVAYWKRRRGDWSHIWKKFRGAQDSVRRHEGKEAFLAYGWSNVACTT